MTDEFAPRDERRVDPADGRLRTFAELHRACAGRYSEAEIHSYWEVTCARHVCSDFEGTWRSGAVTNVIEGKRLSWEVGVESDVHLIGPDACMIELDGQRHSAVLEAGGQRLRWSDGEVWTRCDDNPARSTLVAADAPVFDIGELVKYWSETAMRWVPAVVRGRCSDGWYELDIKRHADPALLRRGSSASKAGDLAETRWRMQLPRALAELQAGDAALFQRLLQERVAARPGIDPESAMCEVLKDAAAACSVLGFAAEEVEQALEASWQRRRAARAGAG
mmetsp:Transcript_119933/g.344658  ORF Transcript_119933/g.344658 Transcript_119933/m.344658 type:complete len:279 (-) Transcript_119933:238-1074(-)